MGGAPSRETLVRGIVRQPSETVLVERISNRPLGVPAPSPSSASVHEMVLIPLIRDYFPSSTCPLFEQFLRVRREVSVVYYNRESRRSRALTDCESTAVLEETRSDAELYNMYLYLSEQRLVESDDDLMALHRAGRVFSPVPCAVALVYDSPQTNQNTRCSSAGCDGATWKGGKGDTYSAGGRLLSQTERGASLQKSGGSGSPVSEVAVRVPHHNISVRIVGFIGDTRSCPASLLHGSAARYPMGLSLFLSKHTGGNHRMKTVLLACYTYVSQLKECGIISNVNLGSIHDVQQLLEVSTPKESGASCGSGHQESLPANLHSHTMYGRKSSSNGLQARLLFRPLEFAVHRGDIPTLCFLRELRARLGPLTTESDSWQLKGQQDLTHLSYDPASKKKSDDSTHPSDVATDRSLSDIADPASFGLDKRSIRTVVDHKELTAYATEEYTKRLVLWGSTFYAQYWPTLTGGESVKLHKMLSSRNEKENRVDGNVFITTELPCNGGDSHRGAYPIQKGDVWMTISEVLLPPLQLETNDGTAEDRYIDRGTVLRFDGCQWVYRHDEFVEDILLSLCREVCLVARKAPPHDPHWVMHRKTGLPMGINVGFLIWREERAGQVVYYGSTPDFAKFIQKKSLSITMSSIPNSDTEMGSAHVKAADPSLSRQQTIAAHPGTWPFRPSGACSSSASLQEVPGSTASSVRESVSSLSHGTNSPNYIFRIHMNVGAANDANQVSDDATPETDRRTVRMANHTREVCVGYRGVSYMNASPNMEPLYLPNAVSQTTAPKNSIPIPFLPLESSTYHGTAAFSTDPFEQGSILQRCGSRQMSIEEWVTANNPYPHSTQVGENRAASVGYASSGMSSPGQVMTRPGRAMSISSNFLTAPSKWELPVYSNSNYTDHQFYRNLETSRPGSCRSTPPSGPYSPTPLTNLAIPYDEQIVFSTRRCNSDMGSAEDGMLYNRACTSAQHACDRYGGFTSHSTPFTSSDCQQHCYYGRTHNVPTNHAKHTNGLALRGDFSGGMDNYLHHNSFNATPTPCNPTVRVGSDSRSGVQYGVYGSHQHGSPSYSQPLLPLAPAHPSKPVSVKSEATPRSSSTPSVQTVRGCTILTQRSPVTISLMQPISADDVPQGNTWQSVDFRVYTPCPISDSDGMSPVPPRSIGLSHQNIQQSICPTIEQGTIVSTGVRCVAGTGKYRWDWRSTPHSTTLLNTE